MPHLSPRPTQRTSRNADLPDGRDAGGGGAGVSYHECMGVCDPQPFDFAARTQEKEDVRRRDRDRLERGEITAAQLKRDCESFAFSPERARIDFSQTGNFQTPNVGIPSVASRAEGAANADTCAPAGFSGRGRPKLLLDVDGVLMPVRTPAMRARRTPWLLARPDFVAVRVDGLPGHVAPWVLDAAADLAERFDIIWATSWEDSANGELRDLFGWDERPWLPILAGMRDGRSRLDVVREAVGEDTPIVWCDDQGVTAAARAWAAGRAGPSLLIRPLSDHGLGPRHIARILKFGALHAAGA